MRININILFSHFSIITMLSTSLISIVVSLLASSTTAAPSEPPALLVKKLSGVHYRHDIQDIINSFGGRIAIQRRGGGGEPGPKPGKLTYNNGPVINKVEVTPLIWGENVPFASEITQFYKAVTDSSHFDWLSEYNTPKMGSISRGSGNDAIKLEGFPTKKLLDNGNDIQKYLRSLVKAGTLKPNSNSYYPIHFASGIDITMDGQRSCQIFCA
jgi:hypothetical protein